jgi:hypothetical protein
MIEKILHSTDAIFPHKSEDTISSDSDVMVLLALKDSPV